MLCNMQINHIVILLKYNIVMQNTVKERLIEFLKSKKISQAKFAKAIGVSTGYVNAIRVSIQPDKLASIASCYPSLNIDWLLTGQGDMLRDNPIQSNAKIVDSIFIDVPFIPIRARAGYLAGYGDQQYINEMPTIPVITDRTFHGKYICFEVEGDSMDDGGRAAIWDGDIILGREIKKDLWQYKLHINKWYFIIVHKEGIMVKQIVDHDLETGIITCHSLNPLYGEDFELNLNDIHELYNVIKIVDRSIR